MALDVVWFRWVRVFVVFFFPFPPSLKVATAKAEPPPAPHSPGGGEHQRAARTEGAGEEQTQRLLDERNPRAPNFAAGTYLSRQRRAWTLPAASRSCRAPGGAGRAGAGRAGAGRRRQLPLRRSGCLPSASLFISISQPLAVPALFTAEPLAPPSRGRSLQPGCISTTGAPMPRCPHGKVSPGSGGCGLLAGLLGVCADPAEHPAGFKRAAGRLLPLQGQGAQAPQPPAPDVLNWGLACIGPSWESADPSGTFPWGCFTLYCPVSGRSMDDTVTQQLQKLP